MNQKPEKPKNKGPEGGCNEQGLEAYGYVLRFLSSMAGGQCKTSCHNYGFSQLRLLQSDPQPHCKTETKLAFLNIDQVLKL